MRDFNRREEPANPENEPTVIQGVVALVALVFVFAMATGQFNNMDFEQIRKGIGYFVRGGLAFAGMLFVYWHLLKATAGTRSGMDSMGTWALATIVVTAVAAFWPEISTFSLDSLLSDLISFDR